MILLIGLILRHSLYLFKSWTWSRFWPLRKCKPCSPWVTKVLTSWINAMISSTISCRLAGTWTLLSSVNSVIHLIPKLKKCSLVMPGKSIGSKPPNISYLVCKSSAATKMILYCHRDTSKLWDKTSSHGCIVLAWCTPRSTISKKNLQTLSLTRFWITRNSNNIWHLI